MVTSDGNQGSNPEREHENGLPHLRKAAGVQITHTWHWEVVTKNINTVGGGAAHGIDLLVFWALTWWCKGCTVRADDHGKLTGMCTSEKSKMMADYFGGNIK